MGKGSNYKIDEVNNLCVLACLPPDLNNLNIQYYFDPSSKVCVQNCSSSTDNSNTYYGYTIAYNTLTFGYTSSVNEGICTRYCTDKAANYYGDTDNLCKICHSNCTACISYTNCSSCIIGLYLDG